MNTRKIVRLFGITLLIGGVLGLFISFFVNPSIYAENFSPFNAMELLGVLLFYTGFGMLASVVSMTGFFAYLFIHRFGLGLFRSFWPTVQVFLVAFVVFDLIYFPYKAADDVSILWFILMAAAILGIGWVVAKIKAKETNKRAFIPTLFFMVVITSIEWVPALRTSDLDYILLMIIPLLVCNTYQILQLHRLQQQK